MATNDLLQWLRIFSRVWPRGGSVALALSLYGLSLPALAVTGTGDFLVTPLYSIEKYCSVSGVDSSLGTEVVEHQYAYSRILLSQTSNCPSQTAISTAAAAEAFVGDQVRLSTPYQYAKAGGARYVITQLDNCSGAGYFNLTNKLAISDDGSGGFNATPWPAGTYCKQRCVINAVNTNHLTWAWYMITSELPPAAGKNVYTDQVFEVDGSVCTTGDSTGVPQPRYTFPELFNSTSDALYSSDGTAGVALDCTDADNDGFDDDTGLACVAQCADSDGDGRDDATGQICGYAQGEQALTDIFSTLRAIPAGDATLADFAGLLPSSLFIPDALMALFTPSGSCTFTFPTVAGQTFAATDYCAIKSAINPFIQFAMFVLTFFIAYRVYTWSVS